MTKYTREEVEKFLTDYCQDPIAFGEAIFTDKLYPSPYRGSDNPFLSDDDPIKFQERLADSFPTPMRFLSQFLGRYLPYDDDPHADWQLSSETVFAFIGMSAIAHVIVNGEDAGYMLAQAEPFYSLAFAKVVQTVMDEYCDDGVTDILGIAIWHPNRVVAVNGFRVLPAGSEVSVTVEATVPKGTDQDTITDALAMMITALADGGTLHLNVKEAA
jgi:hypothetical protein